MITIDMPMPESCAECRFNTSEFGYCNAMPVNFCGQVADKGKPKWCPLKLDTRERVLFEILEMIQDMMEEHGPDNASFRSRFYALKRLADRIQKKYGLDGE